MDITKDYYRTLGVSPLASLTDIRRAYRMQAARWHPDKHIGESPEMIHIAEERFKEINEAYSILSDPSQRSNYDYFRELANANARQQQDDAAYSQSTQSRAGGFWHTILQWFAIAAAVLFYFVFPLSLEVGYWDADVAARDISRKVGTEKQTVLMQSADLKEVKIHAVDLPEIILPKSYDDAFGLKMKTQIMIRDLQDNKSANQFKYESKDFQNSTSTGR